MFLKEKLYVLMPLCFLTFEQGFLPFYFESGSTNNVVSSSWCTLDMNIMDKYRCTDKGWTTLLFP